MSQTATRHECRIDTKLTGVVRVVHVTGRLDWATASSFRDRMQNDWTDEMLIVDLSRMSGVDSAQTGVLLAAAARARQRGQHLVIATVDPILVEVLASLGPEVPIVNSPAQAWRLICAGSQLKAMS
jgi:anti-anti-sigma factor